MSRSRVIDRNLDQPGRVQQPEKRKEGLLESVPRCNVCGILLKFKYVKIPDSVLCPRRLRARIAEAASDEDVPVLLVDKILGSMSVLRHQLPGVKHDLRGQSAIAWQVPCVFLLQGTCLFFGCTYLASLVLLNSPWVCLASCSKDQHGAAASERHCARDAQRTPR